MTIDLTALAAPFPADHIHWRAQNLTRDGDKALALAYLDARDVMDRLDAVCGPANWRDRFEVHGDKTICYLAIRIENEWVEKADGGGDTDIEGEKGALSGALKRAAVKWGIGRYLYDLGNTWVGCESFDRQGKKVWKKWTEDPWSKVRDSHRFLPAANDRGRSAPVAASKPKNDKLLTPKGRERRAGQRLTDSYEITTIAEALLGNIHGKSDPDALKNWAISQREAIGSLPDAAFDEFMDAYEGEMAELTAARVVA